MLAAMSPSILSCCVPLMLALVSVAGPRAPLAEDEAQSLPVALELDQDRVRVRVEGEVFTDFVWSDTRRPYLYPLLGPGGAPLTRGYPMDPRPGEAHDHPHHQSFWFAHGRVDGFDFWHGTDAGERIQLDELEGARIAPDGAAQVDARFSWRVGEGEGRALMIERRSMRFHASTDARRIDVELQLTPAGDASVVFGDTKEGSFALRLAPTLRLQGKVAAGSAVNSAGQEDGAVWGKRAAWVAYNGPVGDEEFTVAIFDHPNNLRHPTWWHARNYGLFAANPFGIHDFDGEPAGAGDYELAPGEELVLRYSVLLLRGERTPAQLAALWDSYAHEGQAR